MIEYSYISAMRIKKSLGIQNKVLSQALEALG